ncbi:hypothetical protein RCL1_000773 [Eukaryota sp. TZLM3-RCL]
MVFNHYRGLHRNVYISAIVSFFAESSIRLLFDLLPLYLSAVLFAPPFFIAFTENITDSFAHFLKFLSGRYADIFGRKMIAGIGYTLAVLPRPLLLNVHSWSLLFFVKLCERVGKGLRYAPRDALLADCTTNEQRAQGFALQRAMDMFGGVVGILVLIITVSIVGQDRLSTRLFNTFNLISMVPASLAAIFWFSLIREEFVAPTEQRNFINDLSQLSTSYFKIFFITILFHLGFLGNSFGILLAKSVGYGLHNILDLLLVSRISGSVGASLLPAMAERWSIKGTTDIGFLSHSASCFVFVVSFYLRNNRIVLALTITLGFILYGFSISIHRSAAKTMATLFVPTNRTGSALGLLFSGIGVSTTVGSLLSGYLYQQGPDLAFYYGAAFGIFSSLILNVCFPERSVPSELLEALVDNVEP